MLITITPAPPNSTEAQALIAELEAVLDPLYPSESRHGYSVEKLIAEAVAFFLICVDGAAAGCGGVKVEAGYGEVKRMYVRPAYRGLGLAKRMLAHLEANARSQGIGVLRLETGIYQQEAIGLYEKMGFAQIPAFGPYQEDPLSRYFEKQLDPREP